LLATLPEIGLLELPITAVHAAVRPSVDCAESCRAA
jgi:hypothetical protein